MQREGKSGWWLLGVFCVLSFLLIFFSACSTSGTYGKEDFKILKTMAEVDIWLCEGFENDRVEVYLDGKRIFSKKVTTDHSLGLADYSMTLKRVPCLSMVKIHVVNRGLKKEFLVNWDNGYLLKFAISKGEIIYGQRHHMPEPYSELY